MFTAQIEEVGLTKIKQILKDLGGWPVLEGDAWDEASFSWKDNTYKFKDYGYSVDYFIDFSVTIDVKNSTARIIDVSNFIFYNFLDQKFLDHENIL